MTYKNVFRFWEAVQEFRTLPQKKVAGRASEIWVEYLAPEASSQVNIDCRSYNLTKKKLEDPDRWSFDSAAVSTYSLLIRFVKMFLNFRSSIFCYTSYLCLSLISPVTIFVCCRLTYMT